MTAITNIIRRLTSPYEKETTSNNYKFLKVSADECDEINTTISDIQDAHFIDSATEKSLEYIGVLLQTPRETGETDAHYRARLKVMWYRYISSGTIQQIKNIIMALLSVGGNRIDINEDFTTRYADFDIWVFLQDLTAAGVTADELKEILGQVKAAGVSLYIYKYGTFECRTATDPNDPTRGYDDVSHSNPSGGTYAGIL